MLTDEDLKATLAVRGRQLTKYFGDMVALDGSCQESPTYSPDGPGGPLLPA